MALLRRPPYLILKRRADGIARHLYMTDSLEGDLHEGTLGSIEMPHIVEVPDDAILRGKYPRQVMNAVLGWLHKAYPLGRRSPRRIVLSTKVKVANYLNRTTRDPILYRLARAMFTVDDEIVLFPPAYNDLKLPSVLPRAVAARTLAHEYWHALLGTQDDREFNFEEGGADVFADRAMQEMLGADLSWAAFYNNQREAVARLEQAFGPDWALGSRQVPDQRRWLREQLTQLSSDPRAIDEVMKYSDDREHSFEFLRAVQKFLEKVG